MLSTAWKVWTGSTSAVSEKHTSSTNDHSKQTSLTAEAAHVSSQSSQGSHWRQHWKHTQNNRFSEKSVSSSEILEYGNSLLHIKKNEDFYERLFIKSQRLPNCSWMEINEQAWLADCVPWLQADGVKPWSTSIHSSIHLSLLIWLSTLILSVWRDHFATLLVWPAEYHRTHGQNNRHTVGKCKECSVYEHHCVDELMLKPRC